MASNPVSKALRRIGQNFQQAQRRFQSLMDRRGPKAARAALKALKTEPGPPISPWIWQTDKQRRAFFATDGFGRGIPALRGRPPLVTESWEVVFARTNTGGEVALINPVPWMPYVQGDWVQTAHLQTGWVNVQDVTEDFFRETEDTVTVTWFDAAEPFEGVD